MEEKREEKGGESYSIFDDVLEAKICTSIVADYNGTYDTNNKFYEGDGVLSIDNESKYNGTYTNGLFEGKGSFRWQDGVLYTGDFKKGYIEGVGEYQWPDGSTYTGDIVYYKRQGMGKFTGGSGQSYEGSWKNGLRDGHGVLFYDEAQTVSYKGDWKNGMRHGFGIMTYPSGNTYEGEWKFDKKCGQGVMLWSDRNEIYMGQWDNDLANGSGEHIWVEVPQKTIQRQTCNLYRGSFLNGKRNGHGTFFYANGSQYTGEWYNNSKHGQGCFVHVDGRIHFGIFEMDRMILLTDQSKESDAVCAQYRLNVTQMLAELPSIEKAPSFLQQSLDIERLVLRYNTAIRCLLQRYTTVASDVSNMEKTLSQKFNQRYLHPSMLPPTNWNKLQRLFFNRRDIHNKFFTLRMRQLCQFARECDIIGPTMTCFDVCMCVKKMHEEHNSTVSHKAREFFDKVHEMRELARISEEEALEEKSESGVEMNVAATTVLPKVAVDVDPELLRAVEDINLLSVPGIVLDNLLDYTFESDLYTDMRFPLRDREFVEAFVRIVAEASSRKHGGGVSGSGLFDNVYRMLAETMEPLASETRPVPIFVSALYSDAVQNILLSHEGSLRKLWDQVIEIAASSENVQIIDASRPGSRLSSAGNSRIFLTEKQCRPRVKHIVKLFAALRGTALAEEGSSTVDILEALNKRGQAGDLSSLDLEICFDDFTELFCRVVVSNLWIFEPENDSAPKENLDEAIPKEKGNAAIVESALATRLAEWLPLI